MISSAVTCLQGVNERRMAGNTALGSTRLRPNVCLQNKISAISANKGNKWGTDKIAHLGVWRNLAKLLVDLDNLDSRRRGRFLFAARPSRDGGI